MIDFLAPPYAGLFLLSAYEKSHHETVMAKFNFTAYFAGPQRTFCFEIGS